MNIIVHLMFAWTVRNRMKKTLGVTLNLRGFLYGNILPDISRKYGECPHYMRDALSHVVSSKDKLLNNDSCSPSSYQFAKRLGAMNHYLSDFFCLPHNEGYKGSKAHHGYYELMMIARYRKGLRAYRKLLDENKTTLGLRNLRDFIITHNKDYASKKASDVNDIRYALFAVTKLNESILTHSLAGRENEDRFKGLVKVPATL
ncbi:MAG TPA: zinc dependent phospholipase C family protein [Clostridiaceae bacterium]|nr:zinc dependent phospholipase C family protein [Clostridiaceae bacterium]